MAATWKVSMTMMTRVRVYRDTQVRTYSDVCTNHLFWFILLIINPLRAEVYICHQNQNAKYIGNFATLLKPHNIGTHLNGIETSFQVVPLFLKSIKFWVSYFTFWNFLKIPSLFKGLTLSVPYWRTPYVILLLCVMDMPYRCTWYVNI
jgi:hypothetical protein